MIRVGLLAAILAVGCTNVRPCKKNTVFLVVNYDAATSQADQLTVGLSLPSSANDSYTVAHTPGTKTGSFEIDFASSYPSASTLSVTITATNAGAFLATSTQAITLEPTCTHASINLGNGSDSDGGTNLTNGSQCADGSQCQSSFCVDGVCCDRACDGQCEACAESASLGTCTAVQGMPRAPRSACSGTGTCAGSCDGTNAMTCTYPTTACMQSCAAGTAVSQTCSNGTCGGPVMTTHCTANICGGNACATVAEIQAGNQFTCAVLSDGTVRCWGLNSRGQIAQGANDSADRFVPTTVAGVSSVSEVATGQWHACALSNGAVYCWGGNYNGQLGQGTRDLNENNGPPHGSVPVQVPMLTGVKHVYAGVVEDSTCVIMAADGSVKCWGNNNSGQSGDGTSGNVEPSPVQVCASGTGASCVPFTGAKQLAKGYYHTCALTTANALYCWGANDSHQLGIGTDTANHPNPVAITGIEDTGTTITEIAAGGETTCAVLSSGIVKCWGSSGGTAALGSGTNGPTSTATPITLCQSYSGSCTQTLQNVLRVSQSGFGGCAVTSGGGVFCWGFNTSGETGNGMTSATATLVATASSLSAGATDIAGEYQHYCALLTDGSVKCWGDDSQGEIGDNDSVAKANKPSPTAPQW